MWNNSCFDVLPFLATMLQVLATMWNEISSSRQSKNKLLNTLNLYRLCRKEEIWFEIAAKTHCCHCCQKRQQCRSNIRLCRKNKNFTINSIVRHCCRFWQQSRMLLRQRTKSTLLRRYCWCGRDLRCL